VDRGRDLAVAPHDLAVVVDQHEGDAAAVADDSAPLPHREHAQISSRRQASAKTAVSSPGITVAVEYKVGPVVQHAHGRILGQHNEVHIPLVKSRAVDQMADPIAGREHFGARVQRGIA